MMKIVGVMGPGEAATEDEKGLAFELGHALARQGWVLLTGGRNVGVMDAASRGAKSAQGLVVGILPGADHGGISSAVDIPIVTGMGEARDNINVLSSQVLFFIGMNPGTACELALAIKHEKPIILVRPGEDVARFYRSMSGGIQEVEDIPSAVAVASRILGDMEP